MKNLFFFFFFHSSSAHIEMKQKGTSILSFEDNREASGNSYFPRPSAFRAIEWHFFVPFPNLVVQFFVFYFSSHHLDTYTCSEFFFFILSHTQAQNLEQLRVDLFLISRSSVIQKMWRSNLQLKCMYKPNHMAAWPAKWGRREWMLSCPMKHLPKSRHNCVLNN